LPMPIGAARIAHAACTALQHILPTPIGAARMAHADRGSTRPNGFEWMPSQAQAHAERKHTCQAEAHMPGGSAHARRKPTCQAEAHIPGRSTHARRKPCSCKQGQPSGSPARHAMAGTCVAGTTGQGHLTPHAQQASIAGICVAGTCTTGKHSGHMRGGHPSRHAMAGGHLDTTSNRRRRPGRPPGPATAAASKSSHAA
jgi:hypothetical protein